MSNIVIRDNIGQYMKELEAWLTETQDTEPEEMDGFFRKRIDEYEEHMSYWSQAYRTLPQYLPENCRSILDLGCGTGLELEGIFGRFPEAEITGIDLSRTMLDKLADKYPKKGLRLICADYFEADLGEGYDAAVSVESLHHFYPEKKLELYRRVYASLTPGGCLLNCDYIACCPKEELLLLEECEKRREKFGVPKEQFIHFDIPLTLEHELELLREAGFSSAEAVDCIDGATFLRAFRD